MLSDVDKFSYLTSLLKSPRGQCISEMKLTPENYKEVVDLMKAQFWNPQLLINRYAESFDYVETCKVYESCERFEKHVRSCWDDSTKFEIVENWFYHLRCIFSPSSLQWNTPRNEECNVSKIQGRNIGLHRNDDYLQGGVGDAWNNHIWIRFSHEWVWIQYSKSSLVRKAYPAQSTHLAGSKGVLFLI